MKNIKITKSPFLLFLPFFIIYTVLILIFKSDGNFGDESRYILYARNIMNGFYSPPPPNVDIGNGPGYPLILAPFIGLNLSISYIQLLNGVFQYLSVILVYKSLQQIVNLKYTLIFSFAWALYPSFFELMPYILPEIFSSFLITLLIYLILKSFNNNDIKKSRKYIFFAGLTLGYLALTKPIFGYVLMFMMGGIGLLWLLKRKNTEYKKSLAVLIVALIATIPYLIYTYNLTGKIFYWSSFGGNNLYWMSTPFEGEYGSWIEYPVIPHKIGRIPGSGELIKSRHEKDFEEIFKHKGIEKEIAKRGIELNDVMNGIEQDTVLKRIAIQNIKSHPFKFLQNCISNTGRMLFNFPYSYTPQKPRTLVRLPINGTILVLSFICLIITIKNWRKTLFSLRLMLFIGLLYFFGSLLGSADARMFTLVVPILLIWIAFVIQKSVRINFFWK